MKKSFNEFAINRYVEGIFGYGSTPAPTSRAASSGTSGGGAKPPPLPYDESNPVLKKFVDDFAQELGLDPNNLDPWAKKGLYHLVTSLHPDPQIGNPQMGVLNFQYLSNVTDAIVKASMARNGSYDPQNDPILRHAGTPINLVHFLRTKMPNHSFKDNITYQGAKTSDPGASPTKRAADHDEWFHKQNKDYQQNITDTHTPRQASAPISNAPSSSNKSSSTAPPSSISVETVMKAIPMSIFAIKSGSGLKPNVDKIIQDIATEIHRNLGGTGAPLDPVAFKEYLSAKLMANGTPAATSPSAGP